MKWFLSFDTGYAWKRKIDRERVCNKDTKERRYFTKGIFIYSSKQRYEWENVFFKNKIVRTKILLCDKQVTFTNTLYLDIMKLKNEEMNLYDQKLWNKDKKTWFTFDRTKEKIHLCHFDICSRNSLSSDKKFHEYDNHTFKI